jgi:hypothetical protein
MIEHVRLLARQADAPTFLVVDHDESWAGLGAPILYDTREWWSHPAPVTIFRGVPGREVARLAIDIGWSVYVDDEIDTALDDWKDNPIREIVKRGRHLKNKAGRIATVSCMIATHRPGNLPADIVGTFDRVYVGRLQSFTDADRVYREGWIPGTRSAVETREALERKGPGDFTVWPAA